MASARTILAPLLSQNISRQCTRSFTRSAFSRSTPKLRSIPARVFRPEFTPASVRSHSAPATNAKQYEFDRVKQISEAPSQEQILIDVREPSEYQAGYIPGAINIPLKSQPDALFLPEEEFEDRFGFSKPEMDKEVVFYCRSGVRSNAASMLAQQHGYKNVAEYRGSWLDWQEKGGSASKP